MFLLAALLAFGTLAWLEALHADLLAGGRAHFLRDGLLLLPLALAAAWWGTRGGAGAAPGPTRAAARTAAGFTLLLAPAAAAHGALHGFDARALAQAGSHHAAAASGGQAAGEGQGLAGSLLHGSADAMLALPGAFLLCLLAMAWLHRRRSRAILGGAPRRRLLLGASVLLAALAAAIVPVSGAASPDYPKFSIPLVIPPTLTGSDIDLTMSETEEQILPTGPPTRMWTYNGSFPGPIIRRPTGEPTRVRVTNDLPAGSGSASVHHHGAHTTEESDGHPSRFLIGEGETKTYTYPAVEDGGPERAAPQWYHDHRDMVTGRNNWMGLIGAFIYDDPFEQALNLPQGEYDVPLMITDRTFDSDNQIPYTFLSNGVLGDVLLVNGVPQPYQEVDARRYRFRLYNVSNKREYTFRLSNGQQMTQIGTESGLLPAPVSRTSLRLGPAERAEVVIDFDGHLGENIVLQNADAASGPGDRDGEVMEFRVNEDVPETSSPVPDSLRPLPGIGAPVKTRIWSFDRTSARWTINGQVFDPDRVDAKPTLGTTERWIFRNPTSQTHQVHVHLGDQQLVTRNGQPPEPFELLKDTWRVAPGEEVVVDIPFTDYAGTFIFHCHVLEHEDDGMMSQFETVRPPAPPPPQPPAPAAPVTPEPTPAAARKVSLRVRILSSRRLRRILRRGVRFAAGVPVKRARLRAVLRAKGRRLGSVYRRRVSRGRVRLTLRLSRRGKVRLRRLLKRRRRVRAVLVVRSGGKTRRARFVIRRF